MPNAHLEPDVETIVQQLDSLIGELEARGWLRAAAKAESLICQVYEDCDVLIPPQRFERIEVSLGRDWFGTPS